MNKLAGIILLTCMAFIQSCSSPSLQQSNAGKVARIYTGWVDSLQNCVLQLTASVQQKQNLATIRQHFAAARLLYKHAEVFAEYYNPSTAKAINGPALDEVEPDNPEYPTAPTGFQVIEEFIYPQPGSIDYEGLLVQARALNDAVTRLAMVSKTLELTDAHIFDAVRLQLFRTITLGISGFDSPIAFLSLPECKETLLALQEYLTVYAGNAGDTAYTNFVKAVNDCTAYINSNNDFALFNRAVFTAQYINPLCRKLYRFQKQLGVPFFDESRPLKANAATLFDDGAFNAVFYSSARPGSHSNEMIYLGEQLFHEVQLSAGGKRSCASCHQPGKSYTDGLAKNNSFDGKNIIRRNTPTILYAALQGAQFADSRLAYLEDQAKQVIENPDEMHGNLTYAATLLNKDSSYSNLFEKAFNSKGITGEKIQQALAAFIRSKAAFTSRFDDYMRGDYRALTNQEITGFNLFMGKAKCGTCHFTPLFNGNAPPAYVKTESEVLGVPALPKPPYQLDADEGKYILYKSAPHKHSFKTPTLRNIGNTAPYMHNGVFNTLEEVLDFYNKGGGTGLGLQVENQTLPPDELRLTKEEQSAIIAFMKGLTDK
ncbi:cytochrome-c peroxidase [Foetidibacter luteolus]|uniref:cytochrome-c peroxidase n=1 Tax=Foetidibacter luteolus TaxID=2608880 RepID=UPI00129AE39C|nr:cytochrome c peroxidase [Foetidibacter luteolus]